MICNRCHCENPDTSKFCKACGHLLGEDAPQQGAPNAGAAPQMPYPYTPAKRVGILDICGIIGFVGSTLGWFVAWAILCPVGLICSIIGFRGHYTRGLSVAGMVLSILGILIRVMEVLYRYNLLPAWVFQGVFH